MPFINKSEVTKRLRDRKENGKCTNATNRRTLVGLSTTEADKGQSQNIYEIRKNVFKIRKHVSNRNVFWKSSLKSLSNLKKTITNLNKIIKSANIIL